MTRYIDIVFDGPPGPEAGRFVEVENANGRSVKAGEWIERPDGYWALRVTDENFIDAVRSASKHMHVAGTTVGQDIDKCALCGHDIRHSIHSED